MRWRTALATGAVVALAAVPVVVLVGTDGASAQQPGETADSEWNAGECPLHGGTVEAMRQQMGQMHLVDNGSPQGMMSGEFGTMMGPGHGQMMGSGMGG
ncbi:MAG TPA: hypothetical protein VIL12_06770 [Acidimicrobiia bacterium]